MGLVSVLGNDVDAYYGRLLAGESSVGPIDRFDASQFPTRFAAQIRGFSSEGYIDGKLGRRLDDCHRYALVGAKRALESAGLALGSNVMEKINKERAGLVVGSGMGGIRAFSDGVENLVTKGCRKTSPFCIPHAISNTGSALVAMDTDTGSDSISTACATSNRCFHSATDQIRIGRADVMVAGAAVAAIVPIGLGGFVACRALSQRNNDPRTASRPWDRDRDGFVMGEGTGVLVNHINAHATSTPAGDLAEVNASKQVFKVKDPSQIKLNATKSMIGHYLGAAGGLEAIAAIKAITTGWVHPTMNQFISIYAISRD